jgi:hypothetical protein
MEMAAEFFKRTAPRCVVNTVCDKPPFFAEMPIKKTRAKAANQAQLVSHYIKFISAFISSYFIHLPSVCVLILHKARPLT